MADDVDIAERAISEAAEQKASERVQEVQAEADARVEQAQEDADRRTLEARIAALESRGADNVPDITASLSAALAPVLERLERLEKPTEPPAPEPTPEPAPERDPFASQIDFSALARSTPERMPRIGHRIFRRVGR